MCTFANPSKYSARYFFGIFLQHRKMEASDESIVCTSTTNKNSAQFTSKQNTLYNCIKIQKLSADHPTCPNHSFLTLRNVLFVSFRSLLYFSSFLYFTLASLFFFSLSPPFAFVIYLRSVRLSLPVSTCCIQFLLNPNPYIQKTLDFPQTHI